MVGSGAMSTVAGSVGLAGAVVLFRWPQPETMTTAIRGEKARRMFNESPREIAEANGFGGKSVQRFVCLSVGNDSLVMHRSGLGLLSFWVCTTSSCSDRSIPVTAGFNVLPTVLVGSVALKSIALASKAGASATSGWFVPVRGRKYEQRIRAERPLVIERLTTYSEPMVTGAVSRLTGYGELVVAGTLSIPLQLCCTRRVSVSGPIDLSGKSVRLAPRNGVGSEYRASREGGFPSDALRGHFQ